MDSLDIDLAYSTAHGDESETKKKIVKLELYEQRYRQYASQVNSSFTRPNLLERDKIAELIDCEELEVTQHSDSSTNSSKYPTRSSPPINIPTSPL